MLQQLMDTEVIPPVVVPKKKKRVNSKGKGNGFERVIANLLTARLSPFNFTRSQSSGAIVGGKNWATKGQIFSKEALTLFVGDVVPTNEAEVGKSFRFSIECKSYGDAERMETLFGNSSIYLWVNEAIDDAKKLKKDPIAIFKWKNTPIYAAFPEYIYLPIKNKIILLNGVQLCHLEDILALKDFWDVAPINPHADVAPQLCADNT